MSLLSKLAKGAKNVIKSVARSPVTAMLPGPVGAIAKAGAALGIGAGVAKVAVSSSKALVPLGGKVISKPGVGKIAAATVGGTIAGDYLYDAAGNIVGQHRRHRRMNVLNGKAATRAIRRVKGVRKMLQKIERQLPKAKATHSRKCA
jgi:hypothetical protein